MRTTSGKLDERPLLVRRQVVEGAVARPGRRCRRWCRGGRRRWLRRRAAPRPTRGDRVLDRWRLRPRLLPSARDRVARAPCKVAVQPHQGLTAGRRHSNSTVLAEHGVVGSKYALAHIIRSVGPHGVRVSGVRRVRSPRQWSVLAREVLPRLFLGVVELFQ